MRNRSDSFAPAVAAYPTASSVATYFLLLVLATTFSPSNVAAASCKHNFQSAGEFAGEFLFPNRAELNASSVNAVDFVRRTKKYNTNCNCVVYQGTAVD